MANELATTNTQLPMIAIPDGFVNTVNMDSFEGAAAVANALNASVSLNEYENDILYVVDIVTVPGVRVQSGEECINTHLILNDGTTVFSQSAGIARSAKFIVGFLGDYIHDGIRLRVKEQKLRNGNTLKSLEIVSASA